MDITKEYTIMGATGYYGAQDENKVETYYNSITKTNTSISEESINSFIKERDKLKIKVRIGNRIFGVPESQYLQYLGDILGKKLDEIIYELNISKYIRSLEEIDDGESQIDYLQMIYAKFKDAKDEIIDYYSQGTFVEDCGGIVLSSLKTLTNITKSDVSQTIKEENDGIRKVKDEFILTANANYLVKWSFNYDIDSEGNIISDVTVECNPIENYHLQ